MDANEIYNGNHFTIVYIYILNHYVVYLKLI